MGSLTALKEKTRQTATTRTTTTTTSDVVMVELFQVMSHCISSEKDSDNNDFKIQGMNNATVIGSAPTALTSSTAQIKVPMSHIAYLMPYVSNICISSVLPSNMFYFIKSCAFGRVHPTLIASNLPPLHLLCTSIEDKVPFLSCRHLRRRMIRIVKNR